MYWMRILVVIVIVIVIVVVIVLIHCPSKANKAKKSPISLHRVLQLLLISHPTTPT